MSSNQPKHILIAPLDWGLGHTTRCIPIVRRLIALGHVPLFAGNSWQRRFMIETIAGIRQFHLDGYNVRYSKTGKGFIWALLQQLPRIIKEIKREHQWLKELVRTEKIDGIISDNRYGLHHPHLPSVIMTHQLQVQSRMGSIADEALRQIHYKYINRFSECWIVDAPYENNLAGILSHPSSLPQRSRYVGLLSQYAGAPYHPEKNHLLILLSGPEPQRSILSHKLWKEVSNYPRKVVFIEGTDQAEEKKHVPAHIYYHRRLAGEQLLPLLQEAFMVVSRSGYSTLMDLTLLNKPAIVIPTPGQTEQEYLARRLHEKQAFYHVEQNNIHLNEALQHALLYSPKNLSLQGAYSLYEKQIEGWINDL